MAYYTCSDVIDTVLSRLENNDQMFPRDHIRRQLNYGLQITNLFVGWYQGTEQVTTVSNKVGYDIPATIIFPTSAYFNGRRLNKSPLSSLNANAPNLWKASTSSEDIGVSEWALLGLRKFVIYPSDSQGGNTIEISGVIEPILYEQETDSINVPINVMNSIIDLATHAVQVKLGGKAFADSMNYFKSFAAFNRVNTMWRQTQQPYFNTEISVKQ